MICNKNLFLGEDNIFKSDIKPKPKNKTQIKYNELFSKKKRQQVSGNKKKEPDNGTSFFIRANNLCFSPIEILSRQNLVFN